MRLRQVVLVVDDVEAARTALSEVFGIEEAFREQTTLGLAMVNVLMSFGDTFLEVCTGDTPQSPVYRYLERNGQGGYMLLLQVDRFDEALHEIEEAGVRTVWEFETRDHRERHLHPKDIAGPIVAVSWSRHREDWRWAGPNWRSTVRTDTVLGISAVEISSGDPSALASRWETVFGLRFVAEEGSITASVGDRVVRITENDGVPTRIAAVDVVAVDPEGILRRARAAGFAAGDDWLEMLGMRFRMR
jgi:hypothetical protein